MACDIRTQNEYMITHHLHEVTYEFRDALKRGETNALWEKFYSSHPEYAEGDLAEARKQLDNLQDLKVMHDPKANKWWANSQGRAIPPELFRYLELWAKPKYGENYTAPVKLPPFNPEMIHTQGQKPTETKPVSKPVEKKAKEAKE